MPRTMQAAQPFAIVFDMMLIALRDLMRSFVADLRDIAGAAVRAVYVPTRQEALMFVLMFSLGANLVTMLAIATHV